MQLLLCNRAQSPISRQTTTRRNQPAAPSPTQDPFATLQADTESAEAALDEAEQYAPPNNRNNTKM